MEGKKVFIACGDQANQRYLEVVIKSLGLEIMPTKNEIHVMIVDDEIEGLKNLAPETPAIILSGYITVKHEPVIKYLTKKELLNDKIIISTPASKLQIKESLQKILQKVPD